MGPLMEKALKCKKLVTLITSFVFNHKFRVLNFISHFCNKFFYVKLFWYTKYCIIIVLIF